MEALEYSSVGDPSCMHNDVMEETNHALYSNYNMNPQYNQDLPITKCREEVNLKKDIFLFLLFNLGTPM